MKDNILNITINTDKKIIYVYERINFDYLFKFIKALDPDNYDKYLISSFEYEDDINNDDKSVSDNITYVNPVHYVSTITT